MECGKVSPPPPPPLAGSQALSGRGSACSGIEEALDCLENGMRALFTETASSRSLAENAHPLCECALLLPPPHAFRWLRRLPVLKRRAFGVWKQQIDQLDAHGAQLTRTAAATAVFCSVLAQCGLLDGRETELMRLLVGSSYPAVLKVVLLSEPTRSRSQKLLLPLRARLLLASFAFQHLVSVDGSSDGDTASSALKWTAEVAAKLAEELMEAAVKAAPPMKEKSSRARRCEFCRSAHCDGSATRSGGADQWVVIFTSIQKRLAVPQGDNDQAECKAAMEALVALRNAIVTSGVASRDAPTSIHALSSPPAESLQDPAEVPSPSKLFLALTRYDRSVVTISTRQYKQICRDVIQLAGSRSRVNRSASSDDGMVCPRLESLWAMAWQKDFQRRQESSSIHLAEVIMQCARADAFALAAAGQSSQKISDSLVARLPGCEVVVRVVASAETISGVSIISAFAHVWAQYDSLFNRHRRSQGAVGASASISTAVKELCVVYLQQTLSRAGSVGPRSALDTSADRSTSPVKDQGHTLLESLDCISLMVSNRREGAQWNDLWDSALLYHDRSSSYAPVHRSDGIRWCSSIKTLLLAVSGSDELPVAATLQHDLCKYCLVIAHGVLGTGGAFMSSGGRLQRELIQEVTDRESVQQLLLAMLEQFGQEWACKLLLNLLRSLARATARTADIQLWIGVRTLLFPVMATHLRVESHSSSSRRHQACRDRFVGMLRSVAEQLRREEVGNEYLSALLGFCCAWDDFQLSQEKEAQRDAEAVKWGVQAVVDMGIYPELIERYGNAHGALSREKTGTLMFLSEVLQRASNYPRSLETQLFDLVTRIAEAVSANETSETGFLSEKRDRAGCIPRISHSSEALRTVFRAASVADAAHMQDAMRQLEDGAGLAPLVQQLKRWILLMEAEQDYSVGREARIEFAVLCNRLMYWAPVQCRDLQLLATPLDARLIGAVKGFMKLTRKIKLSENAASALEIAAPPMSLLVRVEMAVRAYLRGGTLPDLCELTMLLVEAVVRCEERSAREELASVVQRNSSVLIIECVVAALSKALKSIHAFNASLTGDGVRQAAKESFRHVMTASWRAVSALEILSSAKPVFGVPALAWSSSLLDGESVSLWLPYFFDFVLGTGLHPASDTLVKSFINSIIVSLNRDDEDARLGTFQSSYWLVGMLSAVQFANRLQLVAVAGADQEQYGTLQSVLSALLSKLVIVSVQSIGDETDEEEGKSSSQVLVVWQWPMRAGRATIEQDKLWFSDGVQILNDDVDEAVGDIFFDDAVDATTGASTRPSVGVMLSFPQWLVAAITFSQAFVNEPNRSQAPPLSLAIKSWERTFLYCANDLYLPLEFGNCAFSLARAWLLTWISSNLSCGETGASLHALPFQVAWFQRMIRIATDARHVRRGVESQGKVFKLVFQTLALATANVSGTDAASSAFSVGLRCLEVVELIDLSISVDFAEEDAGAPGDDLIAGIEELVAMVRPLLLPSAVACQILQCPLELAVFLYVCKLSDGGDHDGSFQFLDRLRAAIKDIGGEDATTPSVLDSWQQWGCKMQVKYSCFDRSRCLDVLQAIIEVATPSDDEEDPGSALTGV